MTQLFSENFVVVHEMGEDCEEKFVESSVKRNLGNGTYESKQFKERSRNKVNVLILHLVVLQSWKKATLTCIVLIPE